MRKTDLTGTKFLIVASALAGTVGGWILLSLSGGGPSGDPIRDQGLVDILRRPLPTLAGPAVSNGESAANQGLPSPEQPILQPTLRSVIEQPAPPPAAITRSSR